MSFPNTTLALDSHEDDGWIAFDTDAKGLFFASRQGSSTSTAVTSLEFGEPQPPQPGQDEARLKLQQEQEARIKSLEDQATDKAVEEARLKAEVHARLKEKEQARRIARRIAREEQFRIMAEEDAKLKEQEAKSNAPQAKLKVQEIAIVEYFDGEEDDKQEDTPHKEPAPGTCPVVSTGPPLEQECQEVDLGEFQQIADQHAAETKQKEVVEEEVAESPKQEEKVAKKNKRRWFRSSQSKKDKKMPTQKANKSASSKTTAAGADVAAASSENAPEGQNVELVESDTEGSIGTDNSNWDMDTRAFMEEYDNRNDGAYDAVFKKIGGFVCGSTCVDDDSQIIQEETSIASPPRKKSRDFCSDTQARTAATKKGGESTKRKETKKSLASNTPNPTFNVVVSDYDDETDIRRTRSVFDGDDNSEFSESSDDSYFGSEFTASTGQLSFMGNGFFF